MTTNRTSYGIPLWLLVLIIAAIVVVAIFVFPIPQIMAD